VNGTVVVVLAGAGGEALLVEAAAVELAAVVTAAEVVGYTAAEEEVVAGADVEATEDDSGAAELDEDAGAAALEDPVSLQRLEVAWMTAGISEDGHALRTQGVAAPWMREKLAASHWHAVSETEQLVAEETALSRHVFAHAGTAESWATVRPERAATANAEEYLNCILKVGCYFRCIAVNE